jgi:hypothetical protein
MSFRATEDRGGVGKAWVRLLERASEARFWAGDVGGGQRKGKANPPIPAQPNVSRFNVGGKRPNFDESAPRFATAKREPLVKASPACTKPAARASAK